MTVKELRDKLSVLPDDLPVYIDDYEGGPDDIPMDNVSIQEPRAGSKTDSGYRRMPRRLLLSWY